MNSSTLLEMMTREHITHVYLAGINTDFGIFDTALDSFARGQFHTLVVKEVVGSVTGGHEQGLEWIRAHLGMNSVVSLANAVQ